MTSGELVFRIINANIELEYQVITKLEYLLRRFFQNKVIVAVVVSPVNTVCICSVCNSIDIKIHRCWSRRLDGISLRCFLLKVE